MPTVCIPYLSNDTPTTHLYTLSLHDALPISRWLYQLDPQHQAAAYAIARYLFHNKDRKSTRLNSSHVSISYAVFCLKKKKIQEAMNDMLFIKTSSSTPLYR